MQTPIEITLRDVPSSPTLQNLLRQQAKRLDRFCENLTSCRVAIERPHRHQQSGNPYRVRIEVTLPPRKDLVVVQDPEDNQKHTGLHAVIRRAFRTMERQLKDSTDLRRGDVKTHAEPRALVVRLFDDYGFLKIENVFVTEHVHRSRALGQLLVVVGIVIRAPRDLRNIKVAG